MRYVLFCASPEFTPVALRGDERVIACDGGLEYARRLGVAPHLIIGDFDSFTGEAPIGPNVLRLPREKDDTDTAYALRIALDEGADDITLLGATGGRFDHTQSVLAAAAGAAKRGALCRIVDSGCDIYIFSGRQLRICGARGHTLSVLAYSDECRGVTLTGAKWELSGATLRNDYPLGQSNIITADECAISAQTGVLMVIHNRDAAEALT